MHSLELDMIGKAKLLLYLEFQLTGSKSFFIFINVSLSNDYFLIYMHFFCGNLPGVALKLT